MTAPDAADKARVALRDAHAAWKRGEHDVALAGARAAVGLDPEYSGGWTLLGTLLRDRHPQDAEQALRRALALEPGNADARFQLGNLSREQGRFAEAIEAYEAVLAASRPHPGVLNNLGLAYQHAGNFERAEATYLSVLRLHPDHPQALRNLGHLLCASRHYDEALEYLSTYLQRHSRDDADAWVDYGIALHHLRRYAEAEDAFRRALALDPADPVIQVDLGSLLVDGMDFDRALPYLERAAESGAQALYALSLLAYCRQQLCIWRGLDELHRQIRRGIETYPEVAPNPFTVLSVPMNQHEQLRVATLWARGLVSMAPVVPAPVPALRGARPRLAYISSDFRVHPTASLLCEVWERHRGGHFETVAYSIGPNEPSPLRSRIEAAFDRFVDCSECSIEETVRRIRQDGVDVLIDLNGYTTLARSEILALRPAPVQASWLGYLGTSGASWYDYLITDRFVTPEDRQSFFTERFLYLRHCYCPSDTRREIAPLAPSRDECGLPSSGFVFCCFNNQYKILPVVFDAWMRLLGQVPQSVMWLSPTNATAGANLRREAALRGIDPHRLVFAPRIPLPLHLARHVHADLFLDTAPYNAGTTANDALLMGVPVLTVAGSTMASRVAASQLAAIGLAELATSGLSAYEALAAELAGAPASLSEYRHRLRLNRANTALFDMPAFVADLEERLAGVVAPVSGH